MLKKMPKRTTKKRTNRRKEEETIGNILSIIGILGARAIIQGMIEGMTKEGRNQEIIRYIRKIIRILIKSLPLIIIIGLIIILATIRQKEESIQMFSENYPLGISIILIIGVISIATTFGITMILTIKKVMENE